MAVLAASAVPAMRQTRTVTQPDGTTLTLSIQGDEWFHSYVTSDGLSVAFNPEGAAVYLTPGGLSAVLAHEAADRGEAELKFISSSASTPNYDAVRAASPLVREQESRRAFFAPKMTRANGRINIEQGASQVPHKGVAHVPIILVQYTDVAFRDGAAAKQTFEEFFNGEGVSANKYFKDASLGQYDPKFHVVGPYTLPQNRAYYGSNGWTSSDTNVRQMVLDGIAAADPDTDFSIFDNDGDGRCDVVILLYAGVGEASATDVPEAVWPCQWELATAKTCDGVRISKFAVFNELNGTHRDRIDGIGTFCHEFSHCLGLPDFYDVNYKGHFGMDAWSLMDYGSYNNNGYTPTGYSAYEKAFMGWIKIEDGESATQYTLPVLNDPDAPASYAVALTNARDRDEYFIFENRGTKGWDAYNADEGMMITHVTYSSSIWASNKVNTTNPQRMTIVPADNFLSKPTMNGDLWPKEGATEFTNESTPAAKVNTGTYLSRPVTEITRDAETGVVTFWVEKPDRPTLSTPEPPAPSAGSEPGSFTATWAPVETEDIDLTYTLQVWPKNMATPMPELWQDFTLDDGLTWKTSGTVIKSSSGITLGSANQEGSITSVECVTPDNGEVTIVTKASRYGADATTVTLAYTLIDADGNDAAYFEESVNSKKIYRSHLFTGLPAGKSYRVKVSNKGLKMRASVQSVMVFSGDCAEAEDALYDAALELAKEGAAAPRRAVTVDIKGERITISGITGTSHVVTGLTPGETYCYRVKAVPVDPAQAYDSFWSAPAEVNLSTLGINSAAADAPRATYIISNGEVIANPGSRLFSVSGTEIAPVSDGRFAPAPGAYILTSPAMAPAKIVLR